MSETLLIALLGLAGTILISTVSFVLGKRWERQRQSMVIRAQMLVPIEEWLRGAERMIGILGDTMSSIAAQSPLPVTYSLEERRKAAQYMIEKTNVVIGILHSNSLRTRSTRKISGQLSQVIRHLDQQIKFVLLPLDDEILTRSLAKKLTHEFLLKAGQTKIALEAEVQLAYSLISQLKTAFT